MIGTSPPLYRLHPVLPIFPRHPEARAAHLVRARRPTVLQMPGHGARRVVQALGAGTTSFLPGRQGPRRIVGHPDLCAPPVLGRPGRRPVESTSTRAARTLLLAPGWASKPLGRAIPPVEPAAWQALLWWWRLVAFPCPAYPHCQLHRADTPEPTDAENAETGLCATLQARSAYTAPASATNHPADGRTGPPSLDCPK